MKLKFLFLLHLFLTIKSFSQAYIPFQFGNTRWKNTEADFGYSKNICYFSTDTVGILINGKKYLPIEKSQSPTPLGGVYRYIYDDTAQRKVFVFNPIDSTENLLYDFSAHAGDTIKGIMKINHFTSFVDLDTVIVDSVITKNINSINRKYFYIKNIHGWHELPYIEGIGSTAELFDPTLKNKWTDPVFYFNCYQYNANTLYPDTLNGTNTCNNFLTSVYDLKNTNSICIYPNPSERGIFNINTTEKFEWKVLNLEGEIISVGNQYIIDISNQAIGIYYLQIQTEKEIVTKKIIKE